MIKKIVAFIALAVYMQTALYAQENQNRTLINAALHGWEYEIRAGVSIGGTSPLPLPVEIRSIDAYNPTSVSYTHLASLVSSISFPYL